MNVTSPRETARVVVELAGAADKGARQLNMLLSAADQPAAEAAVMSDDVAEGLPTWVAGLVERIRDNNNGALQGIASLRRDADVLGLEHYGLDTLIDDGARFQRDLDSLAPRLEEASAEEIRSGALRAALDAIRPDGDRVASEAKSFLDSNRETFERAEAGYQAFVRRLES